MDDQLDEAAIAQMMGFSSFGGQDRPQKKRRYNPGADAQIQISKPESSTGSNATPLGARKVEEAATATSANSGPGTKANGDEINLGDQDDEEPATPAPLQQDQPLPQGLPQRPVFPPLPAVPSPSSNTARQGSRNGQGAWYQDYYDPRFNQNPWDKLERSLGIESQGTWISRDSHHGTGVSA